MYFIYGTENFLIENEIKKIIKKIGSEPIFFDETNHKDDYISEINIIPMFEDGKLIVLKDINELTKKDGTDDLLQAIKDNKNYVQFIFILNQDKPNPSNPLVKWLMDNAITSKFEELNKKDIFEVVKGLVEDSGATITNKANIMLSAKLPNNLRIINNEISKLLLETKNINEDVVQKSISKYLNDDFFALSNSLINKDAQEIWSSYKEKEDNGEEVTSIISSISSTLLLASKINDFKNKGLSLKEISDILKIHIFRVKRSNELLSNSQSGSINNLLVQLSNLDTNIKMGLIDPKIGLEAFLLNYIK